jgi:hypothetical protein
VFCPLGVSALVSVRAPGVGLAMIVDLGVAAGALGVGVSTCVRGLGVVSRRLRFWRPWRVGSLGIGNPWRSRAIVPSGFRR